MNALTSVGLGRAPWRKHRRRAEDLVRAAQLVVLAPQPPDLLALLTAQQLRASARLGPAHPLAQRLRMDPQIVRDLRDWPVALQRQPHTTLDELIGVLLRTGHSGGASPPARTESSHRGLRETRPGSHARTSTPTARTRRAKPSSSAGTTPSPLTAPPRRPRTTPPADTPNPARDTAPQAVPSRVELQTDAQSAPGRPSLTTFHAKDQVGLPSPQPCDRERPQSFQGPSGRAGAPLDRPPPPRDEVVAGRHVLAAD